jgi:hypothetical protein
VRIHVLYRSTASENKKARPSWYSKDVALASFIGALERCADVGDVVFVNDGPGVPEPRLRRMDTAGELLEIDQRGNGGSYRYLLALAESRPWADDDLVYFAEDDYLYLPSAISELCDAARTVPQASFFTPYDHTDNYEHRVQLAFARWHRNDRWDVGGREWRAIRSTTLTYAARLADFRAQLWIHFLGTNDHPADDYIWGASQTFTGRGLLPLVFGCTNPRNRVSVNVKRAGLFLADYRAHRNERFLIAPTRSLATHIQEPFLAPGVDWAAVAHELAG